MSHHVIAAIRSPRIGGPLRVLNERTFRNRYEADQWIGASRARWCAGINQPESHVLILILNGQMKPLCLFEQPADWSLPAAKFTGTHLETALKAFRLDDRAPAAVSDEPVVCTTQDMTDRNGLEGVAA